MSGWSTLLLDAFRHARKLGPPTYSMTVNPPGTRGSSMKLKICDAGVGHLRQELALGHGSRRLVRVVRGVQAFEHHHAPGHVVVLRQVDPPHAAVGDHAHDFVLAGHHVARVQRRRGDALFHHGRLWVDQRFFRFGGLHPGQLNHAVGDDAGGAAGAATLAERVEGEPARALGGVLAVAAPAQLVQVFEQAGHFAHGGVVRLIVGEGVKRYRLGARLGVIILVREGVEGHRFGVLLQRVLFIVFSAHCPSLRYISGGGEDSAMEPPSQVE